MAATDATNAMTPMAGAATGNEPDIERGYKLFDACQDCKRAAPNVRNAQNACIFAGADLAISLSTLKAAVDHVV
jgi:hypothetical protein